MIVVGLLYNFNGMATWCIEAAYALHEHGEHVLLVVDSSQRADLKAEDFPFPIFFWQSEPFQFSASKWKRVSSFITSTFSGASSGFASKLTRALGQEGITPSVFLFNQSNLQDSACPIPQYIVAWAYPTTLWAYLRKTVQQNDHIWNKQFLMSISSAVSWYLKDKRAYREATGVMAVSKRLHQSLLEQKIRAELVYPPLRLEHLPPLFVGGEPRKAIRILCAAVDLENPQKKIIWALNALQPFAKHLSLEFHLVGQYEELPRMLKNWGLHGTLYGFLSRPDLKRIMHQCDLFLFASSFDDWGYVQVEALAANLLVIAPNISPCDEIIGTQELLFESGNSTSLVACIERLIHEGRIDYWKEKNKERISTFGSQHFVKRLEKWIP